MLELVMTFCVGLRTKDHIIALADTRLTSGDIDYAVTSKKVFSFTDKKHCMFILLSGLKSISDMVMTYLQERSEYLYKCEKLYQGVELVAKIVRELREREEVWLDKGDVEFDLSYLVGGQFPEDKTNELFRVYPEGSWKRIAEDTPFEIIGEGRYGKYILEYSANFNSTPTEALTIGMLAFDATQKSYPLCSPPVDLISYKAGSFRIKQKRLTAKQIQNISTAWIKHLNTGLKKLAKISTNLLK